MPNAPLSWRKRMPAALVTSVKVGSDPAAPRCACVDAPERGDDRHRHGDHGGGRVASSMS